IARLERFVTRFRAGTRARQAQSRAKKLAKIDRLSRGPTDGSALEFSFKPPERSGRVVFELENGHVAVGERELLDDVELWLERGEHVSLVGPNGAGKTTLIETLAGRRELNAAGPGPIVEGKLRTGHNVKLSFLSQHAEELSAGTARTVLEATTHLTKLTPNNARGLLGRFLFSGEDAEKPLEVLSGGERRRLSLAILVQSGANVLILDEPTNHLDLESREALESALENFPATVLLVSHDRALLDAVAERTLAIEEEAVSSYDGGWADYVRAREARTEVSDTPSRPIKPRTRQVSDTRPKGPTKLERVEAEIAAQEEAVAALERRLAEDWGNAELLAAHTAARDELQGLLERWEALFEEAQAPEVGSPG
ncbi:MAG TPA: ATP-binding cassette domain-containing protein, partial [Gaiellaceae bacterium]|nr:ATP-binding cassette domain-containing protein [Gaiellaceae bacterium]